MISNNRHTKKKSKIRVMLLIIAAITFSLAFVAHAIAGSVLSTGGTQLGVRLSSFSNIPDNPPENGTNIGLRITSTYTPPPENPEYNIAVSKDDSVDAASVSPEKYTYSATGEDAPEGTWPMTVTLTSTPKSGWLEPEWVCASHNASQVSIANANSANTTATIQAGTSGNVWFSVSYKMNATYNLAAERGDHALSVKVITPESQTYIYSPTDETTEVKLEAVPAMGYVGSPEWSATVSGQKATESQISFSKNADGTFATDDKGYYTAIILPGTQGDVAFTAAYSTFDAYDVSATSGTNAVNASVSESDSTPTIIKGEESEDGTSSYTYKYNPTQGTNVVINAAPKDGYTYDATWKVTFGGKEITENTGYEPASGKTDGDGSGIGSMVKAALHSPIASYPVPAKDANGEDIPGKWTAVIQPGVTGAVVFTPSFTTPATYDLSTEEGSHVESDSAKVTLPTTAEYTFSTQTTQAVTLDAEPLGGWDKSKGKWTVYINDGTTGEDVDENGYRPCDAAKVTVPEWDAANKEWTASIKPNTFGDIQFRISFDEGQVYNVSANATGENVASADAFNPQADEDPAKHQYTFSDTGTTTIEIHAAPTRGFSSSVEWEITADGTPVAADRVSTPEKQPSASWLPYSIWKATIQSGTYGDIVFRPSFTTASTYSITAERGQGTLSAQAHSNSYAYSNETTEVKLSASSVATYTGNATWSATIDGQPAGDKITYAKNEDGTFATDTEGKYTAIIQPDVIGNIVFTAAFTTPTAYTVKATAKADAPYNAETASVEASSTEPTIIKGEDGTYSYTYEYNPIQDTNVVINAAPKAGYTYDAEWEIYLNGNKLETQAPDENDPETGVSEFSTDTAVKSALRSPTVTVPVPVEGQPGQWTAVIEAGASGEVEFIPTFGTSNTFSISGEATNATLAFSDTTYTFSTIEDKSVTITPTMVSGFDISKATWTVYTDAQFDSDGKFTSGTETTDETIITTPTYADGKWTSTILKNTSGAVYYKAEFNDGLVYDVAADTKGSNVKANSASVEPDTYTFAAKDDSGDDSVEEITLSAEPIDGYSYDAEWEIYVDATFDDEGNLNNADTSKDADFSKVSKPEPAKDEDGDLVQGKWTAQIKKGTYGYVLFRPSFTTEATYNLSADAADTTVVDDQHKTSNDEPNVEDQSTSVEVTLPNPADESAKTKYTFVDSSKTDTTAVKLDATPVSGWDKSQGTWELWIKDGSTGEGVVDGYKQYSFGAAGTGKVTEPVYSAENDNWTCEINPGTFGDIEFRVYFPKEEEYGITFEAAENGNVQILENASPYVDKNTYTFTWRESDNAATLTLKAQPTDGYDVSVPTWKVVLRDEDVTNETDSISTALKPIVAKDESGKEIPGQWIATVPAMCYGDIKYTVAFNKSLDYSISTQRGDHALEVTASPESYSFGTDAAIDLKATPTLGYTGNAEWSATVNGVAATSEQIVFGTDTKGVCTATILAGTLGPVVFTASFADHDAYAVSASAGQHVQSASVAPSSSTPTIVKGADDAYTYTYDPAQDTHVVIDAKPNDGYTTKASWVIKVNGGNDAGGYEITYAADSDDSDAGDGSEGGDTDDDNTDNTGGSGSGDDVASANATVVKAAMHAPTVTKPQLVTDADGNVSWTAEIQAGFAGTVEFVPSFNEASEFQIAATGVQNYKVNQVEGEEVSSVQVVRPVDAEGNHTYTYYPTPTGDGTDTTEVELTADPTDGYVKDSATWELWINDGTGSAENNGYTQYQFGTSTDAEPGDGKVTKPVYNSDTGTWTCTILQGTLGAIDFRVSFTEGKSYNVAIDVTAEDDNVREDLDVAKWGPSVSPDTYTFVPTSSEETKAGTVTIKAQPERGYSAQDVVWEVTVGEGDSATTFTIDAEHENDGTVISTPAYNADAQARYWTTDIQKGVFGDITIKPSFPKEATYNITTSKKALNLDSTFLDDSDGVTEVDKSTIKNQLFEAGTENWEITEPKSETYTYNKENEITITYAADILEGFDPTRFNFTVHYPYGTVSDPSTSDYDPTHPDYDPTNDRTSDEYIDPWDFSGTQKWDSENNCWRLTLPKNIRGDLVILVFDRTLYKHQVNFMNYDGVDDNGDAKPYTQYYPTSTKTKYPYWATYTGKYVLQETMYGADRWPLPSGGEGPVTWVEVVDSTIMPDKEPTRPDDAYYTYTFKGWTEEENPAIDADVIPMEELEASVVKGDKTYYAVYTRVPRQYVVTAEPNGSTVDEHHVLDSKVEILEPEATTTEEGPKHYYSAYPEDSTERTKVIITAEPAEGWKANPTWEITVNGVKVEDAYPEPPTSSGGGTDPDDGTSTGTTVKAAMYVQPTQVTMPVWDANANDGKGAYVAEILPGVFGDVEFKVSFNDPDAFQIAFMNEHVKDSEGNATTLYAEDINAGTPYPEFMESDDFKDQVGTPQKPWDNDHAYYFKGWTEEANADVDADVIPMMADPDNPSAVTPMDQRTVDSAKTYYAVFRSVALHDMTIELYKYADASGNAQQYDYAGPDASSTGSYTVRLPETTSSDDLRQVSVKLPATTATIPAQMKDGSAAEGIAGHMMTSWYLPTSDPSASDANAKVDLEVASGEGASAPTTFSFAGATGEGSDGYLTVTADKLLPADKLPVTGDVTVKLVAGWRATIQGTAATDAARFNLKTDTSGSMEAAQFVQLQSTTARALAVSATSAPDAEAFAKLFRTQDGSAAPTEADMAATAFRFPYFERDYWSTNDETEAYDKAHEFSYTGGAASSQLCMIEGTNSIDQSTTVGKLGLCLADTLRTLTQDEVDGGTFNLNESEEEGGGKGEQLGKIVWQLQMLHEADAHQYAFGSATQTWWGEWFE